MAPVAAECSVVTTGGTQWVSVGHACCVACFFIEESNFYVPFNDFPYNQIFYILKIRDMMSPTELINTGLRA